MVNVVIDLSLHAPYLKYLIKNSLYYGEEKKYNFSSNHDNNYILSNFNFDLNKQKKEICNLKKIDNLFFVMSILSTEKKHQKKTTQKFIDMYTKIYNKFHKLVENKIILIDNHDGDYEPTVYINKFKFNYDIILKRVFSSRNIEKYKNNTFTFPFVMCTSNDPMYKLYNLNMICTPIDNKINKIYFSGSVFEHHEEWDNKNINEHANRKIIINNINKNILDFKRVPYNKFHKTISEYKYALDIRGASRLNKRLYEILSTNTLLLAEKIDIIWPFEDGDSFSKECFFEQGNVNDLHRIYNNFENNPELYKKCLENQIYIVNKYFNNAWIWNYIEKILHN